MKKLQVPFNLDRDLFDVYEEYKDYIDQVFFACHPKLFPSARQTAYPDSDSMLQLNIDLCEKLYTLNIKSFVLLNGSNIIIDNDKYIELYEYLTELQEHHLTGVVVANPILSHWVHQYFPNLKIKYSILSNMDTYEKIKLVDQLNYVYEICLPLWMNKDKDLLKKLKENTKIKYSIIVNSLCRADCPLYGWHQLYVNSNDNICKNVQSTSLKMLYSLTYSMPTGVETTSFILPEKLNEYDDIIDGYKLEDRTMLTSEIKTTLYYYSKRINPETLHKCIHGSCLSGHINLNDKTLLK